MASPYLKMRASSTGADKRSESVDLSELLRPQLTLPRMLAEMTTVWNNEALIECRDDGINGERFGTVLGIRRSVSSPPDPRKVFQLVRKQRVGKYSAYGRLFSMRRSTSVSERYCRIQDQSDTPTAYLEGEERGTPTMKGRSKFIKACKSLFNLK